MSEEDHEVHLPKESAVKLLTGAINNYASANDKRLPDRVVIHKSSGFDKAELDGFNEAAESQTVRFRDYMALTRSQIRFFRYGSYPPLRGTHIIFDEKTRFYIRAAVFRFIASIRDRMFLEPCTSVIFKRTEARLSLPQRFLR